MYKRLIPWWSILIVAPLCVWLASLAGCTNNSYWTKVRDPVPFNGIKLTITPGNDPKKIGFANIYTGIVEIQPGLSDVQMTCVFNHELKHLAGYSHPKPRGVEFAIDCGDGTIY